MPTVKEPSHAKSVTWICWDSRYWKSCDVRNIFYRLTWTGKICRYRTNTERFFWSYALTANLKNNGFCFLALWLANSSGLQATVKWFPTQWNISFFGCTKQLSIRASGFVWLLSQGLAKASCTTSLNEIVTNSGASRINLLLVKRSYKKGSLIYIKECIDGYQRKSLQISMTFNALCKHLDSGQMPRTGKRTIMHCPRGISRRFEDLRGIYGCFPSVELKLKGIALTRSRNHTEGK